MARPSAHSGPEPIGQRLGEQPHVGGVDVVATDVVGRVVEVVQGVGRQQRAGPIDQVVDRGGVVARVVEQAERLAADLAARQHGRVVAGQAQVEQRDPGRRVAGLGQVVAGAWSQPAISRLSANEP